MSSLYHMLHGISPNAGLILRALEIDPHRIERFRDASFGKDGDVHVFDLLCRTGGGNRDDHPNDELTAHPLYLRDRDDDHDTTYAHYYFRIPQSVLDELAEQGLSLDNVTVTATLGEKMEAAIAAVKGSSLLPRKES